MNPLNEWFEEYEGCGCVSRTFRRKIELWGYCPKHGGNRRALYKNGVLVDRRVSKRSAALAMRDAAASIGSAEQDGGT